MIVFYQPGFRGLNDPHQTVMRHACQSGNDDQFLPRNLQVKVLEIVLARTTDLDNLRTYSDVESRTF
jgi:hypothetical protein